MLTKRENEVLGILIEGLTTLDIAAQLFISTQTVESHRRNIIQKLGVKNMINAAVKAMRIGLIE